MKDSDQCSRDNEQGGAELRRGKWTPEEEKYANKIIELFDEGTLPISNGTTLRSYLSEKLCCGPMRITKKYAGDSSLGKKVFSWRPEVYTATELAQLRELQYLENQFHLRLQSKGQKLASKGGQTFVAAAASALSAAGSSVDWGLSTAASSSDMVGFDPNSVAVMAANMSFGDTGPGQKASAAPSPTADIGRGASASASASTSSGSISSVSKGLMRVMSEPNLLAAGQISQLGQIHGGLASRYDMGAAVGRKRSSSITKYTGIAGSSSCGIAMGGIGAAPSSADSELDELSHPDPRYPQQRLVAAQLMMAAPTGVLSDAAVSASTSAGLLLSGRSALLQPATQGQLLFFGDSFGALGGGNPALFQRPPHLGMSLKRSRSVSDMGELERLAEDDEAAGDLFLDFVSKVACRRPSIVDADVQPPVVRI